MTTDPDDCAHRPLQDSGSFEREERETLCWRPWPCARCRAGTSTIGYLRRRYSASPVVSGRDKNEIIDRQIAAEIPWLKEWIETCKHNQEKRIHAKHLATGSEHAVYLHEDSGSVFKQTILGNYGEFYVVEHGRMFQYKSTPGEYLIRLRLIQKRFGFSMRPLGLTACGRIVSQQQFVTGTKPDQKEVDEFLIAAGLIAERQQHWLWRTPEPIDGLQIWVGDARADNFVKTVAGIVPIDLRMWQVFSPDETEPVV